MQARHFSKPATPEVDPKDMSDDANYHSLPDSSLLELLSQQSIPIEELNGKIERYFKN